jgi:hypothetical protein
MKGNSQTHLSSKGRSCPPSLSEIILYKKHKWQDIGMNFENLYLYMMALFGTSLHSNLLENGENCGTSRFYMLISQILICTRSFIIQGPPCI